MTVNDPVGSRAPGGYSHCSKPPTPDGPTRLRRRNWITRLAPWLGRFWGDGLAKTQSPAINEADPRLVTPDPAGLVAPPPIIAAGRPVEEDETRGGYVRTHGERPRPGRVADGPETSGATSESRPEGLVEAAQILNAHRDQVLR